MISKLDVPKVNWPLYLVIVGYSAYIMHVLLPTVSTRISSIFALIVLMIVYLGIFFDKEVSLNSFVKIIFRYVCAGIFSFFMWWIGRKEHTTFTVYMARAVMLWSPVMIAGYLKIKQNKKANKILALVVLGSIAITCFTTLFHYNQYPYASRVLSGGGRPDLILRFRKMNIGGYGFIYALAISIPLIVSFIKTANRVIHKFMLGIVLIVIGITIVLSQYLIAVYMLILSTATILLFQTLCWVANLVKRRSISKTVIMILSAFIALIVFGLNVSAINKGLKDSFEKLSLSILTIRTETVSSIRTPEDASNSGEQNNAEQRGLTAKSEDHLLDDNVKLPNTKKPAIFIEEGTKNESSASNADRMTLNNLTTETANADIVVSDETNTSTPLSSRMSFYKRPFQTFMKSPITGNLFGKHISLTEHSEFADALLGGGLIGAALVIALLYSIFHSLFRGVLTSVTQPYLVLMILMILGLGTLNTLTYSREIFLLFVLAPYFMDDEHIRLDRIDVKEVKAINNEVAQ